MSRSLSPRATAAAPRWPGRLRSLAFGGDYNPEQWPEDVWAEDVRLMREAGVILVTVGVFSWALLEPAEGEFDFALAGPRARPAARRRHRSSTSRRRPPRRRRGSRAPPGVAAGHASTGVTLGDGARESLLPQLGRLPAGRGADRRARWPTATPTTRRSPSGTSTTSTARTSAPATATASAQAFRGWLRERYGTLDALNDAWGTSVLGPALRRLGGDHRAAARADRRSTPPSSSTSGASPRPSYLECYRLERDVLRELSPDVPVTTNFMATACPHIDYWRWADEVDVVTNDHYLIAEDPENHVAPGDDRRPLPRARRAAARGCCSSTRRAP